MPTDRKVFYAVLAPRWRRQGYVATCGHRALLRWTIVRESRSYSNGIAAFGYHVVGRYWFRRNAATATLWAWAKDGQADDESLLHMPEEPTDA